jgi:hypothetical protein
MKRITSFLLVAVLGGLKQTSVSASSRMNWMTTFKIKRK